MSNPPPRHLRVVPPLGPEAERRVYAVMFGPAVSVTAALYVTLAVSVAVLFRVWLVPAVLLGVPVLGVLMAGAAGIARTLGRLCDRLPRLDRLTGQLLAVLFTLCLVEFLAYWLASGSWVFPLVLAGGQLALVLGSLRIKRGNE